MFIHKAFLVAALIVGVGSAYPIPEVPNKVAPLTSSEAKLKKCKLHGTPLKTEPIRISYGLASPKPTGYFEASKREFPQSRSHILGGCIIMPDMPKMQTVKYCSKCRTAEKKWIADHTPTQR